MWLGISSVKTEPADKHFTALGCGCSVGKLKICLKFCTHIQPCPTITTHQIRIQCLRLNRAPACSKVNRMVPVRLRIGKDQAFMHKIISLIRFHWPPFPSTSIDKKQILHKSQNCWSCLLDTAFEGECKGSRGKERQHSNRIKVL